MIVTMPAKPFISLASAALLIIVLTSFTYLIKPIESKLIKVDKNGALQYIPDEKGNILPDFSRVGYYSGDRSIPDVAVVKRVKPGI